MYLFCRSDADRAATTMKHLDQESRENLFHTGNIVIVMLATTLRHHTLDLIRYLVATTKPCHWC
jgi:hypothetical protein